MEKTTELTIESTGQNALILVLTQIADRVMTKYGIKVTPELTLAALIGLSAWWNHRRHIKTARLIDTARNSTERLTMPELKAKAKELHNLEKTNVR